MNKKRQVVKKSAEILIETEDYFDKLKIALEKLHQVYYEITGIKAYEPEKDNDTYLEFGKAVSPIVAASCLFDILRTKRFVQGVHKAIIELKKEFKGKKLNILYAGSGPYGLLITPLCLLFKEDDFSCTILDIHEQSINAVKRVIKELEIESYFHDVIHCNAFDYYSSAKNKPHIIISEVLQMALQNEPQVALMHHLAPQLIEGGVFIPKEIKLGLFHSKKSTDTNQVEDIKEEERNLFPRREADFLGNIITLNIQSVNEQLKQNTYPDIKFEPLLIPIPSKRDPNDTLEIQTELETYNNILLTNNQSSLTIPITQTSLRGYNNGTKFRFEYKVSNKPGVDFRCISK